ncbi:hypothetical protein HORIV_57620 [Vreelandella olivaria]|uniref:Uncharacterized protein n=1 Tax=Vreelandella olivaria TaxID=390919 RepID=A0ABM7GRJ6_9GAMM|nr:hypothetical protein HORIV_57620 [Halomonas olivaria]
MPTNSSVTSSSSSVNPLSGVARAWLWKPTIRFSSLDHVIARAMLTWLINSGGEHIVVKKTS